MWYFEDFLQYFETESSDTSAMIHELLKSLLKYSALPESLD